VTNDLLRHEDAQLLSGVRRARGIRHGHEQAADHLAVALLARLRVFTPIVGESMTFLFIRICSSAANAFLRRYRRRTRERLVPRALLQFEIWWSRAAACAVANSHLLDAHIFFHRQVGRGAAAWPSIMNTGSMRSVP